MRDCRSSCPYLAKCPFVIVHPVLCLSFVLVLGLGGGSSRNNCRLKVRDVLMVFIVIDIFVDQSRSKSLQIKLSNECSDERENASRVCEESIFILPLWPPKYAHVFYCGSLWSFSLARAQDGSSNKYD